MYKRRLSFHKVIRARIHTRAANPFRFKVRMNPLKTEIKWRQQLKLSQRLNLYRKVRAFRGLPLNMR